MAMVYLTCLISRSACSISGASPVLKTVHLSCLRLLDHLDRFTFSGRRSSGIANPSAASMLLYSCRPTYNCIRNCGAVTSLKPLPWLHNGSIGLSGTIQFDTTMRLDHTLVRILRQNNADKKINIRLYMVTCRDWSLSRGFLVHQCKDFGVISCEILDDEKITFVFRMP